MRPLVACCYPSTQDVLDDIREFFKPGLPDRRQALSFLDSSQRRLLLNRDANSRLESDYCVGAAVREAFRFDNTCHSQPMPMTNPQPKGLYHK